jgi:hypothetical protein
VQDRRGFGGLTGFRQASDAVKPGCAASFVLVTNGLLLPKACNPSLALRLQRPQALSSRIGNQSVTHVSGLICYLCPRPFTVSSSKRMPRPCSRANRDAAMRRRNSG